MIKNERSDTIVALSTASGVGAIGLVRMSGEEAIAIADEIFYGKKLADMPSHTAHFGLIKSADQKLIDEVVITVFKGPKSYTGEDTIEIACHGSPFIQQQIIQRCIDSGARLAKPGEYTMRAFFNGRLDLSQAEAVGDLIASQNAAAHQVALHQMRGGFKTELATIREQLIHFASLLELELDFSEEDVEFAPRSELKALVQTARKHVTELAATFGLGQAIRNGVNTVIAGRPNAGKSTLLNALLNEERAIVSDIAGTTRDVIEEVFQINGIAFRLMDTAGIRATEDKIEAMGVERTMRKIQQAAIVLYLWDPTSMTIEALNDDLRQYLPKAQVLVVVNKLDQLAHFDAAWLLEESEAHVPHHLKPRGARVPLAENQIIAISAKDKLHLDALKARLYELAIGSEISLESTIVTNARHQEALLHTEIALTATIQGLENGLTNDFLALHMRDALYHIGSITGDITVEDLLGNIFGKFCIGK